MTKLKLNEVKKEVKAKKVKAEKVKIDKTRLTLEEQLKKAKKPELVEMYKNLNTINVDQSNIIDNLEQIISKRNETITAKNKIIEANKLDHNSLLENSKSLENQVEQYKSHRDDWRAKAKATERKLIDAEVNLKEFKEMSAFELIMFIIKR